MDIMVCNSVAIPDITHTTLHTHYTHVQGLVNKHPDVRANHVLAVLAMRGDLNKTSVGKVRHNDKLLLVLPSYYSALKLQLYFGASGCEYDSVFSLPLM